MTRHQLLIRKLRTVIPQTGATKSDIFCKINDPAQRVSRGASIQKINNILRKKDLFRQEDGKIFYIGPKK